MRRLKPHNEFYLVLLVIAIPLLICSCVILLFFRVFFPPGNFFIPIPIQDCMMTGATVTGIVRDSTGEPVANTEIYIENDPVDWSTPVKRTLYSDEKGHFGPESVSYFMCEEISFRITADGFEPQTVSYILDQGLRNSLPNQIEITLERSE